PRARCRLPTCESKGRSPRSHRAGARPASPPDHGCQAPAPPPRPVRQGWACTAYSSRLSSVAVAAVIEVLRRAYGLPHPPGHIALVVVVRRAYADDVALYVQAAKGEGPHVVKLGRGCVAVAAAPPPREHCGSVVRGGAGGADARWEGANVPPPPSGRSHRRIRPMW